MGAKTPEDVDRLFVERVNAGDVEGVLALYEAGATLVLPDGNLTGSAAFHGPTQQMLAAGLWLQMQIQRPSSSGRTWPSSTIMLHLTCISLASGLLLASVSSTPCQYAPDDTLGERCRIILRAILFSQTDARRK
jgi:hypothetical protein